VTTTDCEIPILMDLPADNRRQSALSDRRLNNVNYVRHVLRRFFGGSARKSSPTIGLDESPSEQSPNANTLAGNFSSPVLTHPNLQYDKHTKFSGNTSFEANQCV
jgi:hypothetical protein